MPLLLAISLLFTATLLSTPILLAQDLESVFKSVELTQHDSILVKEIKRNGEQVTLYDWQSDKLLIPASLSKLATSHFALKKWGGSHQFETKFYQDADTLWVQGYGDPFLVSEELDRIAQTLAEHDLSGVRRIVVDTGYFNDVSVPGRSAVLAPYNAPLSAVSANFNTAMLASVNGSIKSAEPQTPLTPTAKRVANTITFPTNGRAIRVNLIDSTNAATHFAELLMLKCGLRGVKIQTGLEVPKTLKSFYEHKNTRTMADNIRGMMEYSNNFIANQLFLSFSGAEGASFQASENKMQKHLKQTFGWGDFSLLEGAGLSRHNKLSAIQINDLLTGLTEVKSLFKSYSVEVASIRAKTGTLNSVRSFAGYITKGDRNVQFVFNFNRQVPYRYRESLLKKLTAAL